MTLKLKKTYTKNLILVNNLDINKIIVSNKFRFVKQNFKYCKKLLHILLQHSVTFH